MIIDKYDIKQAIESNDTGLANEIDRLKAEVKAKKEAEPQYIQKAYCDATEAQTRRKLVQEFKKDMDTALLDLHIQIQENGKTMPALTNIAYAELEELQSKFDDLCDSLINIEKSNINLGE